MFFFLAHADLKQFKKAIQNYDQAIELDPECAAVFYNRGNVYFFKYFYLFFNNNTRIKFLRFFKIFNRLFFFS
jgi:tetratricopeptide (TPR) repeat protein